MVYNSSLFSIFSVFSDRAETENLAVKSAGPHRPQTHPSQIIEMPDIWAGKS